MNLLVCCGVFHPRKGGAESSFFDLAAALAERGHEVTVLTRWFDGMSTVESVRGFEIVREDWPVPYEDLRIDRSFLRRSPGALWRTWRLLRRRRITTVCIGLLDMSAVYLLALRRIAAFRLVTYLHGAEVRDLPGLSKPFDRMVRRCFDASDAIVAVGPALAEAARRAYPHADGKLSVIPNAIDVGRLAATVPESRTRPYFLFLGRLDREKNVDLILRAYALAAPRLPSIDLLVAGTGSEDAALKKLAQELGVLGRGVTFLGSVERERAFALLKGGLALVLASNVESHPIVALESLAAHRPVLATRVSGVTEVVEDGRNGGLFRAGDSTALAELMVRYATDADYRSRLESGAAAVDPGTYDLEPLLIRHLEVLSRPR